MLRMIPTRSRRRSQELLPARMLPSVRTSIDPLIVWRTWLIAPENHRGAGTLPLLTGLFGFPWRSRRLDAKCTIQDRCRTDMPFGPTTIDRHHTLIPDPDCTCGIYASRTTLEGPPLELVPRRTPVATGFVELSGHILQDDKVYRAQQARIVGPIHIQPGRKPITSLIMGRPRWPHTVVQEPGGYRTRWSVGSDGSLFAAWRADIARQLRHRYGVEVVGAADVS